jgi:hypothetical protein
MPLEEQEKKSSTYQQWKSKPWSYRRASRTRKQYMINGSPARQISIYRLTTGRQSLGTYTPAQLIRWIHPSPRMRHTRRASQDIRTWIDMGHGYDTANKGALPSDHRRSKSPFDRQEKWCMHDLDSRLLLTTHPPISSNQLVYICSRKSTS